MLAAVILSGGASTRMGSPKALLPYQGKPFLDHLLEITNHPKISMKRVVLGPHAEAIARETKLTSDEILINENWEQGQLSSIHAALRSLTAGMDGMVLCLIDHPLISAELIAQLIHTFYATGAPIVLPVFDGKRGHPVIFSSRLFEQLLNAPIDQGARAVVWAHAKDVVEMPTTEEGCVLNLNDPDTLARTTR
jgi:molybdenum cofactor cytidylyltransferase